MTTTLTDNQSRTERLEPHHKLVLTATAGGSATVTRLSDTPGGTAQGETAVAASATVTIGPFSIPTYHKIDVVGDSVSYTMNLVDFEAADETAKGAIAAYDEADVGTKTLMAAAREDRVVHVVVHVTTVFADGTGSQPTLLVGETGTTDKFAAAAVFTDAADESKIVLVGTLAADKALLLTQVAAVGNGTGAYTVSAIAVPLA